MDRLSQDNSYIVRKATSYDRLFAMDRELLFQFLNDTQPEEMEALRKIYKADLEDTLVNFINAEVTKARGSLLDVLKHGIEISNMKLELMYTKPATTFNRELLARYEKNIFSVMEEVWASDDERVDLVIFLNGIAIMSFELKCNAVGQSYQDAIYQYRVDRDPNTRLFRFKAGCLVNFAMDLEQVYMTTKLAGNSTFFLPFNMGNGEGVNAGAGIKAAFAPYYTTTLLSASVTPTAIYDLEAQIDAYTVLDLDDIEKANELLYKGNISSKDKQKLTFYFKRAKNRIEQYELIKQHEIVSMMRHFVRFYEFLLQVSCFEDTDLHKKYNFITYLLAYINIKHPGGGYNLDGKIKATNFVQKKSEEHTTPNLVAQPVVKLPTAESFGLTEAKEERLSQIIAEINSRTGKAYDNDVAVKAMLQIRDILLKSDKLKTSARNNTVKDFEFSYFDDIDDALIEGLEQNQDFFSLLLSNDEIKRQVLGIFTDEIYKSLREA